MARIRLIHWKAAEAAPLQAALEKAGHQVAYVERVGSRLMGHLKEQQPEAIVIDLSRLPSHGRIIATMIRQSKYRAIPILFVHGDPAKVEQVHQTLPDAAYAANVAELLKLLKSAKPNANAIAPGAGTGIERPDRTTALKLGLTGKVTVIDPPRGYIRALGLLPEGVEFEEAETANGALTLWWVADATAFEMRLRQARRWAARTKLWILWRKGSKELTQLSIRESCAAFDLVDYKICSVDKTWSGMLFTVKRKS